MKKILLLALAIVFAGSVMAQNVVFMNLDSTTHATTRSGPGNSGWALCDEGGSGGDYQGGHDYWMTIHSNCDSVDTTGTKKMGVTIVSMDIGCRDTFYIYDGPTINSPLLLKRNNCFTTDSNEHFYVGATNPTGELTFRLRSTMHDSTESYAGFHLMLACQYPCEYITSTIDSVFDRTNLRTGEVVGHGKLKWVPAAIDTVFHYLYDTTGYERVYDTVQVNDSIYVIPRDTIYIDTIQTDSIIRVDTLGMVWAALLCEGQGVIFHGHGNYTYNTGYYFPADSNTMFEWEIGSDVYNEIGATSTPPYNGFQTPGCPMITLKLTDPNGCVSRIDASVQARISPNPIKTIFDLSSICNNDSLMVNVGYSGDNGTLTLKKIKFSESVSKVNNVRTFIPDGPRCPVACYQAPVDFTGEFPPGQKIASADEICSICINYEHTFMGDYRIAVSCPIYDENTSNTVGYAILKYGKYGPPSCITCDPMAPADSPDGTSAGGGTYTGYATHNDHRDECDSLNNPFGIGLDYCWSRNENYTLVTGDKADFPTRFQPGNWYISYTGTGQYIFRDTVTLPQMAPNFHYQNATDPVTVQGRMPSNHEDKMDYYSPASDFSELIGCPLAGVWNAEICDYWGGDNGWIFNWSMDICGSATGDCDYQVGIDSVVWHPDTNYATDYRDGLYKGLRINKKWNDTTAAYISSPDTSGDFKVKLSIFDEFGCRWDTLTHITTVHTPTPHLGNDTLLCSVNSIPLDARDSYSDRFHYNYIWEPFGDTTGVIDTRTGSYDTKSYIVEVRNESNNISCSARDTIVVTVNPQPIPNFDPGIYPLEGCEPFTINIDNTTTNGYKYHWVFGDGTYSTLKDPSHSYAAGSYDLKYYVESEKGCKDSLIYANLIHVYPSPKAAFSWEPEFPTVLHPSISLINNTKPDDGSNVYYWEIQYDKDMPYSFHTLTDNNPTWTWRADNGEDVSGNYTIRLLARSDNYGPSGRLVQCSDTVENTILIINDNLKFPNVVTPNGDGINDRFVITNLVEGLAYPINQLDIYDKWGSRVFHAVNIQRDDQFWDPSKTNTPAGTYFYRFSGKGYKGNLEHNGVIEVLK
ncbi:MAG: gliding motility-associated C-terminal domain-containing protein [Bacteroidales bacterium]|nr:gliding motility-associated C-terminal domain-containing protein [Bacteroidales bacterium]